MPYSLSLYGLQKLELNYIPHLKALWLTAEGDDAHGVELVLWPDVRAHANDEDVAKAGGGRDHPNKDPQHDVGQQVFKGWDAVSVGFAAAHMRGIATILEFLEVALRIKKNRVKQKSFVNVIYIYLATKKINK